MLQYTKLFYHVYLGSMARSRAFHVAGVMGGQMGSGADKGKEIVYGGTIYKMATVEPDVGLEEIITCCRVELTTLIEEAVTALVGRIAGRSGGQWAQSIYYSQNCIRGKIYSEYAHTHAA